MEARKSTLHQLGLTSSGDESGTSSLPPELDGLQVSLSLRASDSGVESIVSVAIPSDGYRPAPAKAFAALDPALGISPRSLFSTDRGLECGDPGFSRDVIVTGDEVRCAAALDHTTRLELRRCLAVRSFEVGESKVSHTVSGIPTKAELKSIADTLLEVARLLRMSAASFPERLLGTARRDPVPRVRTRAIAALTVGFAERPETADAIQTLQGRSLEGLFLDHLEAGPRGQGVVFHALSKIGTLNSVERLLKLGGDSDADYFRNVCVDTIQKRLVPVRGLDTGGWLSLAAPEPEQGALSTADEGSTLAIAKSEKD